MGTFIEVPFNLNRKSGKDIGPPRLPPSLHPSYLPVLADAYSLSGLSGKFPGSDITPDN